MAHYYVYIMASHQGTLYIGTTNDLHRRDYEHRHKSVPGFTQKYNVSQLVYYEETADVTSAIAREKQIKGWRRSRKGALVAASNLFWADLSEEWCDDLGLADPSLRVRVTLADSQKLKAVR